MSEELNEGKGLCRGTARVLIRPTKSCLEMGAGAEVMRAALGTIHHANRHGHKEDYLAVALPGMRMGRTGMLPGFEIEVFGSEKALVDLLALDGIAKCMRRGMIQNPEIDETFFESGSFGTAYVRDWASGKYSAGWIRRNQKRAEKRGKTFEFTAPAKQHDGRALALHYGSVAVGIREVAALTTDAPWMVGTYGFSSGQTPAILPVSTAATRTLQDAA